MSNFCLKQGQVLKASVSHLYPTFHRVPPPPSGERQLLPAPFLRSQPIKGVFRVTCQCKFIGPKESVYIFKKRVYLPQDLFRTLQSLLLHNPLEICVTLFFFPIRISTWSYENRVSKQFVIFLNFPCLTNLLCCLPLSFFCLFCG